MKNLLLYEDYLTDLQNKAKDYEKYINKFCVIEFEDNIYLVEFLALALNGYYMKFRNFGINQNWNEIFEDVLHLDEFTILKSFDDLKNAQRKYKIMLNAKKYNL